MADLVPIVAIIFNARNPIPPRISRCRRKRSKKFAIGEPATLLRFGGRKASLVEAFFRKGSQPDLGERIADLSEFLHGFGTAVGGAFDRAMSVVL